MPEALAMHCVAWRHWVQCLLVRITCATVLPRPGAWEVCALRGAKRERGGAPWPWAHVAPELGLPARGAGTGTEGRGGRGHGGEALAGTSPAAVLRSTGVPRWRHSSAWAGLHMGRCTWGQGPRPSAPTPLPDCCEGFAADTHARKAGGMMAYAAALHCRPSLQPVACWRPRCAPDLKQAAAVRIS